MERWLWQFMKRYACIWSLHGHAKQKLFPQSKQTMLNSGEKKEEIAIRWQHEYGLISTSTNVPWKWLTKRNLCENLCLLYIHTIVLCCFVYSYHYRVFFSLIVTFVCVVGTLSWHSIMFTGYYYWKDFPTCWDWLTELKDRTHLFLCSCKKKYPLPKRRFIKFCK